jgi:hypothetical protein
MYMRFVMANLSCLSLSSYETIGENQYDH